MNNIFHLDLDAFFASVEEVIDRTLKNKPMVVSGRLKNSVVSTANYEARKLGIHSAMPIFEAKKIYGGLVVVSGHYHLYDEYSQKFFKILRTFFTNNIEESSIDECYIDISDIIKKHKNEIELAKKIQKTVQHELGITVSIGISYNKFLSKMATDLNKPNGITIIDKNNLEQILWPLNINRMFLIGNSTANKLKKNNINTIGDLAKCEDINLLKSILNKNWFTHLEHANGNGNAKLDLSYNKPKSISTSHTLLNPSNDLNELQNYLKYMIKEIVDKLNYYNLKGRTISIVYKKINRKNYNKSTTVSNYINSFEQIYHHVLELLDQCFFDEEWRLIGAGISNLIENDREELNIFNIIKKQKNAYIKIIDEVNSKIKKDILFLASEKFTTK